MRWAEMIEMKCIRIRKCISNPNDFAYQVWAYEITEL